MTRLKHEMIVQEIYAELNHRRKEHYKEWRRYGNERNLGKSNGMEEAAQVVESITQIKEQDNAQF